MNKDWSCPKKQQARLDTIITQYRTHFGPSVMNQYWSMAGLCDKPGCELDQLINAGLLRDDQFYGVEIVADICDRNEKAYPHAHWYNDDFYYAMAKAKLQSNFKPDIVNADLIQTCLNGSPFINRIIGLLDSGLLVANFIMEHSLYGLKYTCEDVLTSLNEGPRFRAALRSGWKFDNQYYEYAGTGRRSKTVMGSFVFYKHSDSIDFSIAA